MQKWISLLASVLIAGFLAAEAFGGGAGQDPDGSPPNGFAFSSDSPGARVRGVVVSEFRDIPLFTCAFGPDVLGAPELITTLRLRKASRLRAFSHVLTCAGTNACDAACQDFACGRLVSTGKIAEIQSCVLEDLESEIGDEMLDDPTAEVKLKNVEEFVGAPFVQEPPAVPPAVGGVISKTFVADIELSVK